MTARALLSGPTDFAGWRDAARRLAGSGIDPADVVWADGTGGGDLFGDAAAGDAAAGDAAAPVRDVRVPRAFLPLAEQAILHRSAERFGLLYRLLLALQDEPRLLEVASDALVAQVTALAKAVRRDMHKMRAFVRFRETGPEDGASFAAWFEPEHHIVEANAPFFVRRFASMRWTILTPDRCAAWDGTALAFAPGAARAHAPDGDGFEAAWKTYYAHIFNPARLKVSMMKSEMPVKYWRNLPEAELISPLIKAAQTRADTMIASGPTPAKPNRQRAAAVPAKPAAGTLEALRAEATGCRACPLWEPATQTVFGEGPGKAAVMFVGEQPGDKEDLAGRPFVGPAGQLFDRAMREIGVDRAKVYITNAVKHFKFEPRGKFRLHQKPATPEIKACRPWLMRELDLVRPRLVVAMGASAVQSVFGKAMPIGANRGALLDLDEATKALITVHPSYLLRVDDAMKDAEYARFLDDLRLALPLLEDARLAA